MYEIFVNDNRYMIDGLVINGKILKIFGKNIKEFPEKIETITGNVMIDISNFTHKFNVLTDYEDVIMLTNDPEFVETEDNPASNYYIPVTDEQKEAIFEQRKLDMVESSKAVLQEFFKKPVEFTIPNHGTALYAVTKEKQDQMFQTLSSYRTQKEFFDDAKLLWNASGEEMEEWTEEDFLNLIYQVNAYVKPRVKKQQRIEKDILAASIMEDLEMYEDIDYSTIE